MRVSFVGGCHVRGHLVGLDRSFALLSLKGDSSEKSIEFLSRPTAVRRALAIIRENVSRESVLILQLGNFETGVRLAQPPEVMAQIDTEADGYLASSKASTFPSRVNIIWAVLKSFVKVFIIYTYEAVGRKTFDVDHYEREFSELCLGLCDLKLERVIILSPFGSLRPSLNLFRYRAAKVMKRIAEQSGFLYVDVLDAPHWKTLLRALFWRRDLFVDSDHLGVKGHEFVATSLRNVIV